MNKEKFINELRRKLKRLPKEEVDNVIAYYLDYFQDSGKDEKEVLLELDPPSVIASQILSEHAFNDDYTKDTNKGSLNKLMLIILAVFAAPIALPLSLAFILVLLSLVIVVVALGLSFAAIAGAGFLAGGVTFLAGIVVLFKGPATGLFYMGMGLMVIGVGILVALGIKAMFPIVFSGIRNITNKFLNKFNKAKSYKRGDL